MGVPVEVISEEKAKKVIGTDLDGTCVGRQGLAFRYRKC